jgi:hypothetical protein
VRPGHLSIWPLSTIGIRIIADCTVRISFRPTSGTGRELTDNGMWQGDKPRRSVHLRVGDEPRLIPLVLRSINSAQIYCDVQPNIAYVTGEQFLHHHSPHLQLTPGHGYWVTVTLQSGETRCSHDFLLSIPGLGITHMRLEDAIYELPRTRFKRVHESV